MVLPRFRTVLIATFILACSANSIFYFYIGDVLIQNLQSSMIATASTAAQAFDADDINAIRDSSCPYYQQTIHILADIKQSNPLIEYAYIMKMHNGGMIFVADAEGLQTPIDLDGDGRILDKEISPKFGDHYDVSSKDSTLYSMAWHIPVVDQHSEFDRWGTFFSAFAPIKNHNGETIAIIGIDVLASNVSSLRHALMIPFLIYIIILSFCVLSLVLSIATAYRKRIETIEKLDKKKDEFLEIVTHELTFPIFSSIWFMQALIDRKYGLLSNQAKKNVRLIMSNLQDMSYITGLLLDSSRVDLGSLGVVRKKQPIRDCLTEFIDNITKQAQKKGVRFEITCDDMSVKYDKRLLSMALRNILANAVKYTHKGGYVRFSMKIISNAIVATIEDNGIGIPAEQSKNIFKKYFRGKNTKIKNGNGLGLYVSDGAIRSQGGTIEVQSKENEGTTFIVNIPL